MYTKCTSANILRLAILIAASGVAPAALSAAEFPNNKSIRFIIGFPPGGGTDTVGRITGQALSEHLKVPIVIDNRAGASGIIAATIAAKSTPDGHTLFLGTSGAIGVGPSLLAKPPYDPRKDFTPIGMIGSYPNALVVPPQSGLRSAKDLIALAKRQPGKLNFGSSGVGTTLHLSGEMLKMMAGINIVHIPYKGGSPLTTDLLAGRLDFSFAGVPTVIAHLKNDRLRAIAVTSQTRAPTLPDVPTVGESAIPGYLVLNWFGIMAPSQPPTVVVQRLNTALNDVLRRSDVQEQFSNQGITPEPSTPGQLATFVREEISRWAAVIKAANIKAE